MRLYASAAALAATAVLCVLACAVLASSERWRFCVACCSFAGEPFCFSGEPFKFKLFLLAYLRALAARCAGRGEAEEEVLDSEPCFVSESPSKLMVSSGMVLWKLVRLARQCYSKCQLDSKGSKK